MRSLSPLAVAAVLTVGALTARETKVASVLSEESRKLARDALWPLDSSQAASRNQMDLCGLLVVGTFVDFVLSGPLVQCVTLRQSAILKSKN